MAVSRSITRSVVNRKPLYLFIVIPIRTLISPHGMLHTILSFRWGLESLIVCETRDPRFRRPDSLARLTYIAGLKNSVYPYPLLKELIPKEFAPFLREEVQITKKKGWGAICAMFPDLESHPNLSLWGISPEEYEARQYANTKKVGFHLAKMIISRATKRVETDSSIGPETPLELRAGDVTAPLVRGHTPFVIMDEESKGPLSNTGEAEGPYFLEAEDATIYLDEGRESERDEPAVVWRLRQYWQAQGAPTPYSEEEIGAERTHVIRWLGHNLVTPRALGDEQLLLLGTIQGQRAEFVRILSNMLNVDFLPPRLNNWANVGNEREVTVVDGIGDLTYSDTAEEACSCRTKLVRLLDGQSGLYEWGLQGENTFCNSVNTPMILIPHLPGVPASLRLELFHSRLRVAEWISPPPGGTLSGGRLASTLLSAAEGKKEGSPFDWAEYPSLVPLSGFLHGRGTQKRG